MFSPYQIEAVKRAADLPAVVRESGLELRRVGGRHVGWCPFCVKPRTAALTVYFDHYFCFRCRATGTAIDWLTKQGGMRFREAVESLADQFGVSLEGPPVSRPLLLANKEDAAISKWWWRRRRELAEDALSAAVSEGDEDLADTTGRILRWIDHMAPADRLEYFRSHVTSADRSAYREEMASEKAFSEAWLALARQPLTQEVNL